MQTKNTIEKTIEMFKQIFADDNMLYYREFKNRSDLEVKFCAVFIKGLVDSSYINDYIIKPLVEIFIDKASISTDLISLLKESAIPASSVEVTSDSNKLIEAVLNGSTVLVTDGVESALIIETANKEERAITEPESERVVIGPREGFNESLVTNMLLIQKRLKSPNFKCKFKKIGRLTGTKLGICYLDNIASPEVLSMLEKRLEAIDIDGIIDSGYLRELIKGNIFTPFYLVGTTERPDIVAAKLLEGRVALVCDGSPFVLTLPYIFIENFQSNEDYYQNYLFSSLNRFIRWLGFFLTISVPAAYLALTAFHQELIPTQLLLSISASRQGVPFPTVVEVLLMMTVFEILREAGARIPAAIGQAISIVGVLVVGQAAVEAKLISAPMIIITALSGITGFLVPRMAGAVIITRFIFLILASFIGLYGYLFGIIGLFLHLTSIKSYGVPYMLDIGSLKVQDQKDVMIRAPWQSMIFRPSLIGSKNPKRKS